MNTIAFEDGGEHSLGQMMCPQTATYPWPASHTNGTPASPLPQLTILLVRQGLTALRASW